MPTYKRWGTAGVCFYCGCIADSWDHVPPLSLVPSDSMYWEDVAFWLVSACRTCNSYLNNFPVVLIGARKLHLLRMYRSKYRKELRMPDWSDEELAALGKTLRSKVDAGLKTKRLIQAMLGVLERECIEPTLQDYQDR